MKTIKTDIISGFLGAGKTTLIRKLLAETLSKRGEKVVVIENEFGKVGIDGAFLGDAGVNVTEMNSGCICCSLVGDFAEALKKVCADFEPDRIIIEPSGVGKLSDVATAVLGAGVEGLTVNCMTAVVDAKKCRMYLRNFEEFYKNQIESATAVILSRTGSMDRGSIEQAVALVRELNPGATLVTTDWSELDGEAMLSAMENTATAEAEMKKLLEEMEKEEHGHHHHHHHDDDEECDDPECECHHHHDDDDDDDDDDGEHDHHHHHHHHDDDDEEEHEHHHHHHHHHDDDEECDDPECECHHHHHDDDDDEHGHHHHHHHHGHDADEVFSSCGFETAGKFERRFIEACLDRLDSGDFGSVLRCKGVVPSVDGTWIHFDYVPGEKDVRTGPADVTGKLCVIGAGLDKGKIRELFNL